MNSPQSENDQELFVELFSANQRRILGFVVSISPHWGEVDEIFQRVSVVLWQKWSTYDRERDFRTWAFGVARLEVLKFMSERSRRNEVFSSEVMEVIEERVSAVPAELESRMIALEDCMAKMTDDQRSLVLRCYSSTSKIKEVAAQLGTKAQSMYSQLQRVRKMLHQCIDRTLAGQEASQ